MSGFSLAIPLLTHAAQVSIMTPALSIFLMSVPFNHFLSLQLSSHHMQLSMLKFWNLFRPFHIRGCCSFALWLFSMYPVRNKTRHCLFSLILLVHLGSSFFTELNPNALNLTSVKIIVAQSLIIVFIAKESKHCRVNAVALFCKTKLMLLHINPINCSAGELSFLQTSTNGLNDRRKTLLKLLCFLDGKST